MKFKKGDKVICNTVTPLSRIEIKLYGEIIGSFSDKKESLRGWYEMKLNDESISDFMEKDAYEPEVWTAHENQLEYDPKYLREDRLNQIL